MNHCGHNLRITSSDIQCLTYCPLPYNGGGPAQSCVSILENLPAEVLRTTLFLPRSRKRIPDPIICRETLPLALRRLPWSMVSEFGASSLEDHFIRAVAAADPPRTIGYFWPNSPLSVVKYARDRGILTIREMINTYRGTARTILDHAYRRLGLKPIHKITPESVELERQELALYDYIFASNPMVEASLIEAGVDPARIIPASFGWSPSRFARHRAPAQERPFRALFVGSIGIRKGVPQLLAAWRESGLAGELMLAGDVEPAMAVLIKDYRDDPSIRFLKFITDVETLYRSADVFVFPSLEEGGPQVTYEAAGCGLPIITSPMGAGRLVQHDVNGLIVDPTDVGQLTRALTQLASSADLRHRLGRRAMADAGRFTYERIGVERAFKLKALVEARSGA